jgi:hypothetical protein
MACRESKSISEAPDSFADWESISTSTRAFRHFRCRIDGPCEIEKFAQFKRNEMDVNEPSHRRGLRWLDDEVSKAETELAWARHKLENG